MDRLLAYQNAGRLPLPVVFMHHPDGPTDLLDQPMSTNMGLSLADQTKQGVQYGPIDAESEHLQRQLRMALERIHHKAGHSAPIGVTIHYGAENAAAEQPKPLDGMDPVSSAMLLELAETVMPQKSVMHGDRKYTPAMRQIKIQRWMAKRTRRHLAAKTKYTKMKDVAVSKRRCVAGRFVKKSEMERMLGVQAGMHAAMQAMEQVKQNAISVPPETQQVVAKVHEQQSVVQHQSILAGKKEMDAWNSMALYYSQSEP